MAGAVVGLPNTVLPDVMQWEVPSEPRVALLLEVFDLSLTMRKLTYPEYGVLCRTTGWDSLKELVF